MAKRPSAVQQLFEQTGFPDRLEKGLCVATKNACIDLVEQNQFGHCGVERIGALNGEPDISRHGIQGKHFFGLPI